MSAITTDVVLRIDGIGEVQAKLQIAQKELDRLGDAGRRADEGIRKTEQGTRSLGKAWQDMTQPISRVSEGLGKVTFASQALAGVLGIGLGAGLTGALGAAWTALKNLHDVASRLVGPSLDELVSKGRLLNEQHVAQHLRVSGLADVYAQYARSIGTAGDKLTFLERQEAMRRGVRGEIRTVEGNDARSAELQARLDRERAALEQFQQRRAATAAFRGQDVAPGIGERQTADQVRSLESQLRLLDISSRSLQGRGPLRELGRQVATAAQAEMDVLTAKARALWSGAVAVDEKRREGAKRFVAEMRAKKDGGAGAEFGLGDYLAYGSELEARRVGDIAAARAAQTARDEEERQARDAARRRRDEEWGEKYMSEREKGELRGATKAGIGGGWGAMFAKGGDEIRGANEEIAKMMDTTSILASNMGTMSTGFAEAAAGALLFGQNFGKALSMVFKHMAFFNVVKAIENTALGIAATAQLNPVAAGLFFKAAAMHAGLGLLQYGVGSAIGGGGGGGGGVGGSGGGRAPSTGARGPRFGDERREGPKELVINLNFQGQPLVNERGIEEAVRRSLQAGSSRRGMTPLPAR